MRHGTSNRRQRPRPGHTNNGGGSNHHNKNRRPGGSPGHSRTHVFDSNGPDVRIRGTAYQVTEKYLTLAKDAASAGDRVMAESYLQHAEHYQRIISGWAEEDRENAVRSENAPPSFENRRAPVSQNPGNEATDRHSTDDDLALPASIIAPVIKVQDEAFETDSESA